MCLLVLGRRAGGVARFFSRNALSMDVVFERDEDVEGVASGGGGKGVGRERRHSSTSSSVSVSPAGATRAMPHSTTPTNLQRRGALFPLI
jgi:hypothetical protein